MRATPSDQDRDSELICQAGLSGPLLTAELALRPTFTAPSFQVFEPASLLEGGAPHFEMRATGEGDRVAISPGALGPPGQPQRLVQTEQKRGEASENGAAVPRAPA